MSINKAVTGTILAAAVGGVLLACGDGGTTMMVTQGTVIQNVTVVSTRDGSLTPAMTVVVDSGKIQKITAATVLAIGSAQAVDGSGKYVVPGYLDMHTHALPNVDTANNDFPMLLASGVTGVREMGGSAALIQRARQLNADLATGKADTPEILMVPGDIFAGQATTAPVAVAFVQTQKANGADFIKVTAGARDPLLAILAEAKNQGLGVAGHLAPALSAMDSSNAGWRAMEHLGSGWGLILDCASDEVNIRSAILAGAAKPPFPATFVMSPRLYDGTQNAQFYQRVIDTYSKDKCQALAQTFVKNETWQVPTLIRLKAMAFSDTTEFRNDPNLKYVDKTRRALWEQLGQQYGTTIAGNVATTLRQYYGSYQTVTKLMKQNGVKMLAGSDLGGIWVIPGVSLHQEFQELATAGFTPLDILQMTTLNGAQFLKRESTMGAVEEGKNADLVLLEANPIADVSNLAKISGVFLKGKYFSKAAIDKIKAGVSDTYSSLPIQQLSAAIDRSHVD